MNILQNTKPKPFCFVLMPFTESFNDIYEFGIKGACEDSGLYCERVDEQVFLGSMLERIYSQISRADILIADMTGKNPNVFYEVGYAHALGKNVILLTNAAEDIPFDLKHFPHIVYNNEIKNLRNILKRTLNHLISLDSSKPVAQIGIEIFSKNQRLSDGNIVYFYNSDKIPGAELTIMNNSSATYGPGDFRVAVIAPNPFNKSRDKNIIVTALPDGSFMHMMPEFNLLFPGAADKISFFLDYDGIEFPTEFEINIRVFSKLELRDFPLNLKVKKN